MRTKVCVAVAMAVAIVALVLVRQGLTTPSLKRLANRANEFSGSWYFPRGGPYILGFESASQAQLSIENRVVARGVGMVSERVVYPEPGAKAVLFTGPADARLLWHPPGRRGPLEYVPASSLLPQSPDAARFGPDAGTSTLDGIVALAILLVLMSPLGVWLWGQIRVTPWRDQAVVVAVFCVALAIRVWGIGEQGQTWDEDTNWSAGRNYVQNLLDGDFSKAAWQWNFEHPPVGKYIYGIAAQFTDGFSTARLVAALMTSMSCVFLLLVGRRLFGGSVGVLGGVFAATTPHLVAHGQIVGHEAVALLWWSLGVWWALRCGYQQRVSRTQLVALGVIVGLAVASRFTNGLLAPTVWAIMVLGAPPPDRKRVALETAVIVGGVALALLVTVWPALWHGPIEQLQLAWAKLNNLHGVEPFWGQLTNQPPLYYFAVYAAFATPAVVLVGCVLFGVRASVRGHIAMAMVGIAVLMPFAVSASPVRQDGLRYIAPALLFMSLMAAVGWSHVIALVAARFGRLSWLIPGTVASILFFQCWSVQPYYLDYYNELAGGPQRVADSQRFEIGWWGEGLHDAVDYINDHSASEAKVFGLLEGRCVVPTHLAWLRGDLWNSQVVDPKAADWILWYSPVSTTCSVPDTAELVHEVTVRGAPLARVYRARR